MPGSAGWAFEVKFDGVRAVAYTSPDGLRLFSRNDRDVTSSYPDVTAADIGELGEGLVLDGELVALDERGRPDFGLLQHRMHVAHPAAELLEQTPVQYIVFDVLCHNGDSLLTVPYRERREVLAGLGLDGRGALRVPANFVDTPGSVVMDAVAAQGLEGVVAKQLDSVYVPGKRVRSWIKTAIRHTSEVVVLGWSPGPTGRRELGALLLGAYDGEDLVYVGDVGTGFTDATRQYLLDQLRPLQRTSPPVTGEVAHARQVGRDVPVRRARSTGWSPGWWGVLSTGPSPATGTSATPWVASLGAIHDSDAGRCESSLVADARLMLTRGCWI